jgi:hypothetical protein
MLKTIKKLIEIYEIFKLLIKAESYRIIITNQKEHLLSGLCDVYGSDKGSLNISSNVYMWPAHTYTEIYAEIFSGRRESVLRVFECGIGTNNPILESSMGIKGMPGASLRLWKEYFPNAEIFGADIDKTILFQDNRISTYYVDQLSADSVYELWKSIGNSGEFDLMIDDGLHTFNAAVTLFEGSVSMLRSNGVYIIEDIYIRDLKQFYSYFHNKNFKISTAILGRKSLNFEDNCLLIVQKKD